MTDGLDAHFYADDSQLYLSCHPADTELHALRVADCVSRIEHWLATNKLKLNPTKTELICLGSRQQVSRITIESFAFGSTEIARSKVVKDLGFNLDEHLSMSSHVTTLVRSCFYQLRQIRTVIGSLTSTAAASIIHAFVSGRLDYCNGLLCGISACQLRRLQAVQNVAARLTTGSRRYDHITPILNELHWLPIGKRIEFKIAMTVYKCLQGLAPSYLAELCIPLRTTERPSSLRSNDTNQLVVPRTRTVLGGRSFAVAGPQIWNHLPEHIRDHLVAPDAFPKLLKSHYFANAAAAHS